MVIKACFLCFPDILRPGIPGQGNQIDDDVEFAILESNGRISVIPKSQARPITPRDLQIATPYEGIPAIIIEDGKVLDNNLSKNGLDREWLTARLAEQGFEHPGNILVAMLDTRGRLYISKKSEPYIH